MSSSSQPVSADVIAAAAQELKRRRLSAAAATTPAPGKGKDGKAGKVSKGRKGKSATRNCKLQLPQREYRQLRLLKQQLAAANIRAGRQELVRAGLLLLVRLDRADLVLAVRDMVATATSPEPTA
ncbi:MAG: hypothetical protein FAZ92_00196 [Accumulibacter sp.]|jgi:hypothetical protein|uniref:hypothetical protein n=1 Tax=Accumulibacter sp. TaxID=2053492 RepID=UPI00122A722F|nr:hypothetical protein [Accumulibacter sp.]QKS28732.1 MAG: hypothetical protein HT579_07235 [Candidatus Accumulibacter similis]TLD47514.1 MAG: hypothetical protein FAZ92_00196 [Accumulibacter sp.]